MVILKFFMKIFEKFSEQIFKICKPNNNNNIVYSYHDDLQLWLLLNIC